MKAWDLKDFKVKRSMIVRRKNERERERERERKWNKIVGEGRKNEGKKLLMHN